GVITGGAADEQPEARGNQEQGSQRSDRLKQFRRFAEPEVALAAPPQKCDRRRRRKRQGEPPPQLPRIVPPVTFCPQRPAAGDPRGEKSHERDPEWINEKRQRRRLKKLGAREGESSVAEVAAHFAESRLQSLIVARVDCLGDFRAQFVDRRI